MEKSGICFVKQYQFSTPQACPGKSYQKFLNKISSALTELTKLTNTLNDASVSLESEVNKFKIE